MIREPLCARCGAPTAWPVLRCLECSGRRLAFASARAAVAYRGPARPFLRAWKEGGLRRLAPVAADLIAGIIPRPAADIISYIPPDGDRSIRRGHQPAQALAHELGSCWGLEVAPLLARRRTVGRQTGLRLADRRRNMRGAFVSTPTSGSVVLVDDVYTTGATVTAGASALRSAGASSVEVVCFARAVR